MKKWLPIPTRAQWNQWSLPSKVTFVGTVISAISLLLSLIFFSWPLSDGAGRSSPEISASQRRTALTTADARLAIDAMVHEFPGSSELRVLSITSPVEGIVAVALTPPYREFPNVVLFAYDEGARHWKRVLEGLSLGIQAHKSSTLDIHTVEEAVDVMQPTEEEARRYLPTISLSFGWVAVPYDRFIHFHPSGRETYYLDKHNYARLAGELSEHPRPDKDTECTLFDTPELMGLSLSHSSGRFELQAQTANNQNWTVTFVGIDGNGRLDQKLIRVSKPVTSRETDQEDSALVKLSPDAKIAATAREYQSFPPVARIAFSDIAYPGDPKEYRAMAGHGLLLVTALSQVVDELPPQPYLIVEGRRRHLRLITQEWSTPADSVVLTVFGRFRVDTLYLIPLESSSRGKEVLLDFAKNRTGFKLPPVPAALPDQLRQVVADPPSARVEPDREAMLNLIQREFPALVRPR